MIIQDYVYSLLNVPAITDLVGDGIAPQRAADTEDLPHIVYTIDNETRPPSLGYCPSAQYSVRVDCFGETYAQVRAVALAVQSVLEPDKVPSGFNDNPQEKAYGLTRTYDLWINTSS